MEAHVAARRVGRPLCPDEWQRRLGQGVSDERGAIGEIPDELGPLDLSVIVGTGVGDGDKR